jgi:hypothetical protein
MWSGNRLELQGFMRGMAPHIEAIEQPVQLLAGERDGIVGQMLRPLKSFALQTFLPQANESPRVSWRLVGLS